MSINPSVRTKGELERRATDQLCVEFRQPWLAGVVEYEDSVDHFVCWARTRVLQASSFIVEQYRTGSLNLRARRSLVFFLVEQPDKFI